MLGCLQLYRLDFVVGFEVERVEVVNERVLNEEACGRLVGRSLFLHARVDCCSAGAASELLIRPGRIVLRVLSPRKDEVLERVYEQWVIDYFQIHFFNNLVFR